MTRSDDRESADVFDFVDAYLSDFERGAERPLAEWLARFPHSPDAIAREWLALRAAQQPEDETRRAATAVAEPVHAADSAAGVRVGPYRLLRELGRGGQGAVWLAEDTRIARRVALKLLASRFDAFNAEALARFRREAEVIARLDHPSLCTIFEAEVEGQTPYIAMRFVDGRTLADLLGEAKEKGRTEALGLAFPPRDTLEVHALLSFFERAARALHAAHEAGVVHRDVKPGNLIVANDGRPVLLDFGLARDEREGSAVITRSGDMFGTPAYMSPEQLALKGDELDRRTDVYSLGMALYESLTLLRPFEKSSRAAMFLAIEREPPPDPRRANPALSEDVKVVLATALEKDRARRYASALDLAEDLRRVREYEPIHARPASVPLRFARWTQRHPVLAVAIIGTLLSLSAGLAVTLNLLAKVEKALEQKGEAIAGKDEALKKVEKALTQKEEALAEKVAAIAGKDAALKVALGQHLMKRSLALVAEDPSAALVLGIEGVERAEMDPTQPDYSTRADLFPALDACWLARGLAADGNTARGTDIALTPDGRTTVAAFDDGEVIGWDTLSGKPVARFAGGTCAARKIAFTADGTRLVTAWDDGVRVFDARTSACLRAVDCGDPVTWLDVSADGSAFLTVVCDEDAFVIDPRNGAKRCRLDADPGGVSRARFVPDEGIVLGLGPKLCLFDAVEGRKLRTLCGSGHCTYCDLAMIGGRAYVLACCADGCVRIFDPIDGVEPAPPLHFDAQPTFVCASPDGRALCVLTTNGDEGWAYSCHLVDGRTLRLGGEEGRRATSAAFSPDGSRLAIASIDSAIRIFDPASGTQLRRIVQQFRPADVRWSSDGQRLVSSTLAGYAHVWFAVARPDTFDLEGHSAAVRSASFSPDGTRALTASDDGTARLWSVPRSADPDHGTQDVPCAPIAVMSHAAPLLRAEFSADGSTVLTLAGNSTAGAWDGATGASLRRMVVLPAAILAGTIDAHGERAACACTDGIARVWKTRSEEPPMELSAPAAPLACARLSDDGAFVAVGLRDDDQVRVHDAHSGVLLRTLHFIRKVPPGGRGVVDIAFRPGTDEIAAACGDQRLRFWHASSGASAGEALAAFQFKSCTFSRDGLRILATGRGLGPGAVRSIDFATGATALPKNKHNDTLTSACYSPDGTLVLTTSTDKSAKVWKAASGTTVAHHSGFASAVLCGGLDTQGAHLRAIVGCEDGRVCVWPVDPLPAAKARKPRELHAWEKDRERTQALPLEYR